MKIRNKITLTYLALALLAVLGISILSSIWMESFFKNKLINDLSIQADVVLYALNQNSTQSYEKKYQTINDIAKIKNIRITLIDSLGKVLIDSEVPIAEIHKVKNHSDRKEVQEALKDGLGFDIRISTTVNHNYFYVAKAINKHQSKNILPLLSIIRLSVPYQIVKSKIDSIRTIIIISSLIVFVGIIAISFFTSKQITKPIMEITNGLKNIRNGNYDIKLKENSNDEIGLVAKAINEMVEKLKQDIDQLKKLAQVRSQFLGNVSHELRTPIFTAQGYLETLINGAVDDKKVNREFLEKAQSNLNRLHYLLEDLINISQIESGEMNLSFRYFKVNEFLESIEKEFAQVLENKNITLKVNSDANDYDEIYGDKERLRQVMTNLINNAIKYNKPNGKVIISAKTEKDNIEIAVEDTGVGIAEEHLTRIFERFYRVDEDRSRALGGTGLGLAIVKHIVEAHNSKIKVESVVGKGSKFSFLIKKS